MIRHKNFLPGLVALCVAPTLCAAPIEIRGKVVPSQQARLSAQLDGVLTNIVKVGTKVEKGEVLARLDASDAELQVQLAQQQLEAQKVEMSQHKVRLKQAESMVKLRQVDVDLARNNYRRIQRLQARGAVSEVELNETRLQLQRAESHLAEAGNVLEGTKSGIEIARVHEKAQRLHLRAAELHLKKHALTAPFSGTVLAVAEGVGGSVRAHRGPLLHLASQDRLVVELAIPQQFLSRIEESVVISFPDLEQLKPVSGKLTFVAPVIEQNRTCVIRVSAKMPEQTIRIGTEARVSISLQK